MLVHHILKSRGKPIGERLAIIIYKCCEGRDDKGRELCSV
jgi:hypothetical protein